MLCILEQSDNKVKENMLTYFALLMQDVIELSVNTGHMLRYCRKWKEVDYHGWNQIYLKRLKLETLKEFFKVTKLLPTQWSKLNVASSFSKGQCKFDNGHVANGILYQDYCSLCMKETQRKYDHPLCKCLRVKIVKDPDSIPPSDRRWLLVTWSADFASVGPTLAIGRIISRF